MEHAGTTLCKKGLSGKFLIFQKTLLDIQVIILHLISFSQDYYLLSYYKINCYIFNLDEKSKISPCLQDSFYIRRLIMTEKISDIQCKSQWCNVKIRKAILELVGPLEIHDKIVSTNLYMSTNKTMSLFFLGKWTHYFPNFILQLYLYSFEVACKLSHP